MRRRTLLLLSALAAAAPAQEALPPWVRLAMPEGWMRLEAPRVFASQTPRPRRALTGRAVVEVVDRPSSSSDRLIQLELAAQAREALRLSPGSLLGAELGAFMAEGSNPRPDFTKALLDASMEYWMPRPFHLEGLAYQSGGFGLSLTATGTLGPSDTSRRGPFGR